MMKFARVSFAAAALFVSSESAAAPIFQQTISGTVELPYSTDQLSSDPIYSPYDIDVTTSDIIIPFQIRFVLRQTTTIVPATQSNGEFIDDFYPFGFNVFFEAPPSGPVIVNFDPAMSRVSETVAVTTPGEEMVNELASIFSVRGNLLIYGDVAEGEELFRAVLTGAGIDYESTVESASQRLDYEGFVFLGEVPAPPAVWLLGLGLSAVAGGRLQLKRRRSA